MKKIIASFITLSLLFVSCKQNESTGEMEPSWVFWVLLGLIALGLIFGVISNSIRRKGNGDDKPDKTAEEIQKYEETLNKKEKEEEENNK